MKLLTESILLVILYGGLCVELLTTNDAHLQNQLSSLDSDSVNCLSISLGSNKNSWVVFGNDPKGSIDPAYELKDTLSFLPRSICEFSNLRELDVSMLGLSELPNCLKALQGLRVLNISFNNLNLAEYVESLSSLHSLEELKIYGINFTDSDIFFLLKYNPKLKIHYTRDDLVGEQNE